MKTGRFVALPLAVLVVAAAAAQEREPRVRRHRGGATMRFDPAKSLRALEELEETLSKTRWVSRRVSLSLDEAFDGDLPSCSARSVRIVERKVPPRLVGKTMLWSRTGGEADVVFRTKARSLRELIRSGALPGDASFAGKWGVRCVPTNVIFLSRNAVRLEEGSR
jgi:hypothetical protein